MSHEALNIKGIFVSFSWDFHALLMGYFNENPMKIRPLKSPEKPMKNL